MFTVHCVKCARQWTGERLSGPWKPSARSRMNPDDMRDVQPVNRLTSAAHSGTSRGSAKRNGRPTEPGVYDIDGRTALLWVHESYTDPKSDWVSWSFVEAE